MERKSFYSEIKVQSFANRSPLFQLLDSLRWNRQNTWNTLPVLPIHKNCYIPLTLISSIPPLPISKNHQKEFSLILM